MSAHHRYEVPWAPAPVVEAPQGPVAPEHKLHLPHAQTLRSRFLDPLAITLRQTRLQSVPLSITLCVAVLAFLAGTWINTAGSLPTPEGPLVRANHGLVGVVNSSDTCRHPNRSLFEEFLMPCPHPCMSSPTHAGHRGRWQQLKASHAAQQQWRVHSSTAGQAVTSAQPSAAGGV